MKRARGGILTIALFAVAATLLIFSVVGSSQAALSYFSDTYGAEVSMQEIGVTLVENGEPVSSRDYLGSNDQWSGGNGELVTKMLNTGANGAKEELKLGRSYKEELAVKNSGVIDEYVRVTIYKYWADASGRKTSQTAALDSDLIDLELTLGNGWRLDETAGSQTEERTVLYYDPILRSGDTTPAFSSTLTLDAMPIEASVERHESVDEYGKQVIETTYTYDNVQFMLKVDVDAVQTHNADDAKMSAWGTLG